MRILLLELSPQITGAQISLLTLARHLPCDRHRFALVGSEPGTVLDEARKLGLETLPISGLHPVSWRTLGESLRHELLRGRVEILKQSPAFLSGMCRLGRVISSWKPDLVHINGWQYAQFIAPWCLLRSLPFSVHLRDLDSPREDTSTAWLLRRSPGQIAISHTVKGYWISRGLLPDRIRVLSNPIDESLLQNAGAPPEWLSALITLHSNALWVGLPGQLCHRKGQDFLIRLAAQLTGPGNSPVHFVVLGQDLEKGGENLRALQQQAAVSGAGDRIHFHPFEPRIASFYRAMDIVVSPARSEGFGRVIAEAMLLGRPVVASDVGGHREIVSAPDQAVLLPVDDEDAWIAALSGLLAHPEQRQSMGEAARRAIQGRFDPGTHVRGMLEFWERVLP